MLLTSEEQNQVSDAIRDVELRTDAELVTVLAREADDYLYIPTLWAAVLALLTPLVLMASPLWLRMSDVFLVQLGVFAVLTWLGRRRFIMHRLIPARVRAWRAQNLARRQFLENGLHHTQNECGVLIFVSEAEHYVEILADRGLDDVVADERWQQLVDAFTARVRRRETLTGFLECIHECGDILAEAAPASMEKNELPDHLIVLD